MTNQIKNVCVFASSSNYLDQKFYEDAEELGRLMGQNNFNIVYGGSRLGLMYACAKEVKNSGGDIIAVMPQKLYDLGVGNPDDCKGFYITEGMRERKAKMDQLSDAVIVLPGGFGSLEECSEMIVQKQLGYNNKPIIFLNTLGFYENLNNFFKDIMEFNFAKKETSRLYYFANTPYDVMNYIKSYSFNNREFTTKF